MKLWLVAVGLLLAMNVTLAQDRKVVGRVLSAEGQQPITNANVIITGTKIGTTTNIRGYFELTVPSDSSLVISHVGYATRKVKVPHADRFQVLLQKQLILLETIPLTAYPKKPVPAKPFLQSLPDSLAVVESLANFPTGMRNFYVLAGNALYAQFKDYTGPLTIVFTVDGSGKMVDIHASDSTLNKVIANDWKYLPAWTPATQGDQKVPQQFILPVIGKEPEGFYKYITDNMIIPPKAQRQGIEGRYFMSFSASNEGVISDIKVVQGLGADYDVETTRVISQTPPDIVKSLITRTGANKFMAIFRFELYQPEFATELSYPTITPEQYILGELNITARKRKKSPTE